MEQVCIEILKKFVRDEKIMIRAMDFLWIKTTIIKCCIILMEITILSIELKNNFHLVCVPYWLDFEAP
mgnify:CR=1 FL=1